MFAKNGKRLIKKIKVDMRRHMETEHSMKFD